jgi:hypothetical protein
MNLVDTNAVVNRLLVLHHRSLPMYLGYAAPWMQRGREAAKETLQQIVAAHRQMVDRLGEMILEHGGTIEFGRFPFAYASLHDLSLDYLWSKLVTFQERAVAELQASVEELRLAPLAQALAQEALGEAKGHLESLREVAAQWAAPAATAAGSAAQ